MKKMEKSEPTLMNCNFRNANNSNLKFKQYPWLRSNLSDEHRICVLLYYNISIVQMQTIESDVRCQMYLMYISVLCSTDMDIVHLTSFVVLNYRNITLC